MKWNNAYINTHMTFFLFFKIGGHGWNKIHTGVDAKFTYLQDEV